MAGVAGEPGGGLAGGGGAAAPHPPRTTRRGPARAPHRPGLARGGAAAAGVRGLARGQPRLHAVRLRPAPGDQLHVRAGRGAAGHRHALPRTQLPAQKEQQGKESDSGDEAANHHMLHQRRIPNPDPISEYYSPTDRDFQNRLHRQQPLFDSLRCHCLLLCDDASRNPDKEEFIHEGFPCFSLCPLFNSSWCVPHRVCGTRRPLRTILDCPPWNPLRHGPEFLLRLLHRILCGAPHHHTGQREETSQVHIRKQYCFCQ